MKRRVSGGDEEGADLAGDAVRLVEREEGVTAARDQAGDVLNRIIESAAASGEQA